MSDDTKHIPLRIERMPNGGFLVMEAPMYGSDTGRFLGPLIAATSIGEALEFISRRLDPDALIALKRAQAEAAAAQAKKAHDAEAAEIVAEPVGCRRCGSAGMERYCTRLGCLKEHCTWASA